MSLKITSELKSKMYPEVNTWERNITVCDCGKYLVRVDETENGYRYASWGKEKKISDKPDLVLFSKNGDIGSYGEFKYTFTNGRYIYVVEKTTILTDENEDGLFLHILFDGKNIESIKGVETK